MGVNLFYVLQIVGGQDGMQREKRIKELEQEVARYTEVSVRLQKDLADANSKLAAASGGPPANLNKIHNISDGVSKSITIISIFLTSERFTTKFTYLY